MASRGVGGNRRKGMPQSHRAPKIRKIDKGNHSAHLQALEGGSRGTLFLEKMRTAKSKKEFSVPIESWQVAHTDPADPGPLGAGAVTER
jgi:hypothetical protein